MDYKWTQRNNRCSLGRKGMDKQPFFYLDKYTNKPISLVTSQKKKKELLQ